MKTNKMKAVVYRKNKRPEQLEITSVNTPQPKENEVVVKVKAVSLNAADYRSLSMGMIPKHKIFGSDIAGIVTETGSKVIRFKVGDAVMGELSNFGFGGLAEFVCAPDKAFIPKPEILSWDEAASIPMAAGTALQGLRNKGGIKKGHEVLVVGSSGGVGSFAVQLAKHFGANVTAVCSTANIAQSQSLGATHVIDYTKEKVFDKGKKYDIILGINGSYSFSAYKKSLKPGGICVIIGGSMKQILGSLLLGWAWSLGSSKITTLAEKHSTKDLEMLAELMAKGSLKAVISQRYPLQEAPQAMYKLKHGHASGKVVITMDEE